MPYESYHLLPRSCYVLWYLVKIIVYIKTMALQDIPSSRQDAEHYDYIILLTYLAKYIKAMVIQIFHRNLKLQQHSHPLQHEPQH